MRLGLEAGADTLALAEELGIEGVPVNAADLVEKGLEATLKPLKEKGLSVCQIGAFGFNPLSTDGDAQKKQRKMLEQAIPLASETGCPYIVICGGNYHPSGFGAHDPRNEQPEALDKIAEVLKPFLELAEENGVYLSIEAYLKTAINSPERFLALKEKVGSDVLKVNIDVTSYYDYQDFIDPSGTVERVCTRLAGHYGLGHIKDIALKEGFHLNAGLAPLGSSPTDWAQVLRLMEPHLPEDGWLILEHVSSPEEARSGVAYLRDAARQAGVSLS